MNKRREKPVSVLDVAATILASQPNHTTIPAWKMHILAYLCQKESVEREGLFLFHEKIVASSLGIMIRELCANHHLQLYLGDRTIGNVNHLSLNQENIIASVLEKHGHKSLSELQDLVRMDTYWKEAHDNKVADFVIIFNPSN